MADFAPVIAFTLQAEGGFVDDPQDPGGATNMGITLATLAEWRGTACTAADVRALTQAEATAIYAARYWNAVCGSDLPAGLDLMVFDFGVNAGVSASARLLQRVAGVEQDGDIGPDTIKASACGLAVLRSRIASLGALQAEYYRGLAGFAVFGAGWLARTTRRQAAALALTIHAPPVAVPAMPPIASSVHAGTGAAMRYAAPQPGADALDDQFNPQTGV
jgi:lysozyme family protein